MKNRNYRLFFSGQIISLTGTWMQQVALGWLVYRMTNSSLLLGLVAFASQIPGLFFMAFAGVVADRYNRHKLLVITQALAMAQALILSVLVLNGSIRIWHIIALSSFLGLVNVFDIPIRQSFVIDLIGRKEDLGNAIALNSSMFNAARLIGPAVAGVLIALAGEGVCFLVNGISYIAVILSLLAMDIKPRKAAARTTHVFQEIKEGFRYAFGFAPIRSILLLLALMGLMGSPYQILLPVFARDILGGGPHTLGFLTSMAGFGALAGAMYLAMRKNVLGLFTIMASTAVIFGCGIIFFSFSRSLWLSMPVIAISGFALMVQMASGNTLLQTMVDEDKRGRVMSFYTLSFMGTMPFGSLIAGSLASEIGAPDTLLIAGCCCIVGAAIFMKRLPLLRTHIHRIYVQKDIIPEVAKGIQMVARL